MISVIHGINMQSRNKKGQFENKSEAKRKVRSIRATDEVWKKLGIMAKQQSITRADLLEKIVNNDRVICSNDKDTKLLEEALNLKANAGGAIKNKIRKYLEKLSF